MKKLFLLLALAITTSFAYCGNYFIMTFTGSDFESGNFIGSGAYKLDLKAECSDIPSISMVIVSGTSQEGYVDLDAISNSGVVYNYNNVIVNPDVNYLLFVNHYNNSRGMVYARLDIEPVY